MRAITMILTLVLGLMTQSLSATFVPVKDDVVEANLDSKGGSYYVDGYVQLNRDARTISLVLQPVMPPCIPDRECTELMPAPVDFFLDEAEASVDECDAILYRAEQNGDQRIKVTVIDNTHYSYARCPTFLPVPKTAVRIEKKFSGSTEAQPIEAYLFGSEFVELRY